jgi:hypothetical protein
MLGVIGESVGRVFEQVKQRPLCLVDTARNIDEPAADLVDLTIPAVLLEQP